MSDVPTPPPPPRPNAQAVAAWLELLLIDPAVPRGQQVAELRALKVAGGYRPTTVAGFFDGDHLSAMAYRAVALSAKAEGVYWTLNPLVPALLARRANRTAPAETGFAAGDKDVTRRRWLLIDADPVRPAGVSASDAEKHLARALAGSVRTFLRDRGWPEPVVADSGNGYHLLYRIDLPADDGGLVQAVLLALAAPLNTDTVKVDTSVFNPGRIAKLYGTWARKGDPIADRPHRLTAVLAVPGCASAHDLAGARLVPVPRELLEQLAAETPPPSTPRPATAPPPPGASGAATARYQHRLQVAAWLTDRGVAFTVKTLADGRTAYLLDACPFNPEHAGKDVAVIQHADGKLGFHCFHASCAGHGWQQCKAKIGKPEAHHYDPPLPRGRKGRPQEPAPAAGEGPDAAADSGRAAPAADWPTIQGNKRQLRHVTADALDAVRARNYPPTLFQRGNTLTRLRCDPDNAAPSLEVLTESAVRGHLARVANWVAVRETRHGQVEEDAPPPLEVVKDLIHLPAWTDVPVLRGVVECPVFTRDGTLVLAPGYHPAARLWYAPAPGLQVPDVPERPEGADIEAAKILLLDELLGDFPFVGAADRANALTILLEHFVRQVIDGPTPLHLVDAPVEGTGKNLLLNALTTVVTGREAEAMAEADSNEEYRKRITAALAEGAPFILLDNINQTLDTGALAAALTARTWKDRILGVSKVVRLPNDATWLATGNNTRMSRELIRRTVWTRIDAKTDAPWKRTEWRHPKLLAWVREHRGLLVWSTLVLVQAWLAAGRPAGRQVLGSFEAWAEVMGGILDVAQVPGLLANDREFRATHADKVSEWQTFVLAWWDAYGTRLVCVDELFRLTEERHLLDAVTGDGSPKSQHTKFGLALSRQKDRVYGGLRIEQPLRDGQPLRDHKHRNVFRLEPQQTATGTMPPESGGEAAP